MGKSIEYVYEPDTIVAQAVLLFFLSLPTPSSEFVNFLTPFF